MFFSYCLLENAYELNFTLILKQKQDQFLAQTFLTTKDTKTKTSKTFKPQTTRNTRKHKGQLFIISNL